jgi:acetyltransferase-like isoleucine patch superfamily enzyme
MKKITYLLSKAQKKSRIPAVINSSIDVTSKVEAASEVVGSSFGRHSFCGYGCQIINCDIGSFCSIANGVVIGGGVHPIDWASTSPVFYRGRDSVKTKFSTHERPPALRTLIGHDVWIGERVIVKAGVNIGTGSIIGMGAVVTRDVDPYSIVGGVPARVIRKRFDDRVINELLKSRWWEAEDEVLRRAARFVKDPARFVEEISK